MGMGEISIWQLLVVIIIVVVPFWKIFGKAGYSPWLSLLMLIPLANFVMLYFLAFASWPALANRRSQ